jgi:hypothetical protein
MRDDHHHFRVEIAHADGVVTGATATGVRVPWHTCPLGAAGVGLLVGHRLAAAVDPGTWMPDRSAQCVHAVDLALLAAGHALDAVGLEYAVTVSPPGGPRREATLRRDGVIALAWSLAGQTIVGPDRFAGLSLAGGPFAAWTSQRLAADTREQAIVLRRACRIAPGRLLDLDRFRFAGEVIAGDNSCYTFRPEVAAVSRRVSGASRPGAGAP